MTSKTTLVITEHEKEMMLKAFEETGSPEIADDISTGKNPILQLHKIDGSENYELTINIGEFVEILQLIIDQLAEKEED